MKKNIFMLTIATLLIGCSLSQNKKSDSSFNYQVDKFADIEILRYQVPEIEKLSLQQKELLYYLTEAALQGRDILYDQNGKYNLAIRRTLEAIYLNFEGNRNSEEFKAFETYLKRVWVSNGIYHHYGNDKFTPAFSEDFFIAEVQKLPAEAWGKIAIPSEMVRTTLAPIIFDPEIAAKKINQDSGVDLILTSAGNYYENITQKEVEAFYSKMKDPKNETPISYGLNSKLIKDAKGGVFEQTYKVGGLYSKALERVVFWLEKAASVAENNQQKAVINQLIAFNKTGDLKEFDQYAILWVKDTVSHIDFVNGFTETYGDPLGMKASWEALVNFKNTEATKRTETISTNAQWFEENSPTDPKFKKTEVKGITAKVINAAILGGDCYPTTPIGINLPNSNWIRSMHGSKSVTIENITEAYDQASHGSGFAEEFAWSNAELELMNNYKFMTNNLHTDLHECLGHGSGKLLAGVDQNALQSYGATIEETRADLFGLYFLASPKMVELGLLPNHEAYKAEYYSYFMNGLMTQQVRIELGKNIEESHMRNRQLITKWVFDKAKEDNSLALKKRNGKTYVVINDYKKIQEHLGELLAEIQRIKSTGDLAAAETIVETYAVKIDPVMHKEILERYATLNLAPYKGFVNPVYTPIFDENGKFKDLKIDYTESYTDQHLRYSRDYSPLPTLN